jgi:hypothetical protein
MNTARLVGEAIFGLMFTQYIAAEAIRLVAPKYHERLLKQARRMAR